MSNKSIVAMTVLALAWSGVASAEVWTNLAYQVLPITSNGGGSPNVLNAPGIGGNNSRWHQSVALSPGNPIWILFDLGEGKSAPVSYARMINTSDNPAGSFNYHLEYLPTGGNPAAADDWVVLTETMRTGMSTGPSDVFVFNQTVDVRALRWVLTDGSANNFRFTRFEFFETNPSTLNLANLTDATLVWSKEQVFPDTEIVFDSTNNFKDMATARNGNVGDRFNSDFPGNPNNPSQQYVTLLLPEAYELQHLRLYNEDDGRSISLFSVEYLAADGTWTTVPGLGNLSNQSNIAEYDLSVIPSATTGLRLNIANPSTHPSDCQLRIWEFEVFGAPIPEPATMTLLALGGLAMLRRRT